MVGYTVDIDPETSARAIGRELSISPKHSIVICRHIKGWRLERAKTFLEEVIAKNPKVDDVCVIGVPNEEWGNTVRAVIQLKKNEQAEPEEILEGCRGELAGYKIPRSVVFVEALPRSPVGKMLREQVRKAYGQP